MNPRILPLSEESLSMAAGVLRTGGLVVFPTDTVYGVGAAASQLAAVDRIYAVKGRDQAKPLQVLLADTADVLDVAGPLSPLGQRAVAGLLPGGVTLVVKNGEKIAPDVVAGGETVGIRVPDLPAVRTLVRALGEPLAATSANRSGQPSPTTAQQAAEQLGADVDLVLDGGPCPVGRESTVIDLTGEAPKVLRWGAVGKDTLAQVLGVDVE